MKKMKSHHLKFLALALLFFTNFTPSNAQETKPSSSFPLIQQYLNATAHQWRLLQVRSQEPELKLGAPILLAGFFCFVAAAISSAGGIGGGGLFIPILTLVARLDLKTASAFSAFMVTGGSVANVICNLFTKSSKFGGKILIDFDLALLLEPCMLLGVSTGVICNRVFPEWLITIIFAVFLSWSTFITCQNGISLWKLESETVSRRGCGELENGLVEKSEIFKGSDEGIEINTEPLLGLEGDNRRLRFPWTKFGTLVVVWFSFFVLYLIRGSKYGQAIMSIGPCGVEYWALILLQILFAISFTSSAMCSKENLDHHPLPDQQDIDDARPREPSKKMIFPVMALVAGILGGLFGIGGGMLISPLLLQVGIAPQVTAATCSFMVFFSSTMSAIQYLMLGMEHTEVAFVFSIVCFVASLAGLLVVQQTISRFGRNSPIVFSVGIVMALSTILMTSFGAVDIWRNYASGKYMGFKLPC
ncbi:sulfite exporter TauE/SafE family protein 5-like isoform X2 [Carica papaya]|uniref:sulfite exporter TauE/SafE family protein 5-like isoform X2 n=1 Tax=Carica papaya TaxID=3649 RepID=UPI000B8CBCD8|nr:sulfite exporter TauE/SafE family protein 5-like isoform X2 [Carica papaya]